MMKQLILLVIAITLTNLCKAQPIRFLMQSDAKETWEKRSSESKFIQTNIQKASIVLTKDGNIIRTNTGEKYLLIGEGVAKQSGKFLHLIWSALDKDYQSCTVWINMVLGRKLNNGKTEMEPKGVIVWYKEVNHEFYYAYYLTEVKEAK